MKFSLKTLGLLTALTLSGSILAGCSLFGGDETASTLPAATSAVNVNINGNVAAGGGAALAPLFGAGFQDGATVQLYNSVTNTVISSTTLGAGGAFSFSVASTTITSVRTTVRVLEKNSGKVALTRFLGKFPTTITSTTTISSVTVDENTSAACANALEVAKTDSTKVDISPLPVGATTVSFATGTNTLDATKSGSLASPVDNAMIVLSNASAAVKAQTVSFSTGLKSALLSVASSVTSASTIFTADAVSITVIVQVIVNVYTVASTVPAVKTAVDSATSNTPLVVNGVTLTSGTAPVANAVTTITTNVTTTVATAVTTIPEISKTEVANNSTATFNATYTKAGGATTVTGITSKTPAFKVTFSSAVGGTLRTRIKLTETVGTTTTSYFVQYQALNAASGDKAWVDIFGSAPAVDTGGTTATFAMSPTSPLKLTSNATYKVELLELGGLTGVSGGSPLLFPPTNSGTFSTGTTI